jgi:hypothetical protein
MPAKTIIALTEIKFYIGSPVEKLGGDYTFQGWVVSAFQKRDGKLRYVVEDARGLLFIFNENQLVLWET